MIADAQLTLRGSLDSLRIVWQTGETLLEPVRFEEDPECTRYNILVAVQEMLTNVLRYALEGGGDQPVQVGFIVSDHHVQVTIRDMGPEFDPLSHDPAPAEEQDGSLRESGYGIFIARSVMDDLEYERSEGCNTLRMTKLIRLVAPAGSAQGRA